MQNMLLAPILANGLADLIAGMLLIFILIVVVLIVVGILFLLTLSKALGKCSPRNRAMEPGLVFLNLIPLFNLFWMFITVLRVAESLDNEYRDRRMSGGGDFGKNLGLATCIIYIVYAVAINTQATVGFILGIGWLVVWIMYWVRIATLSGDLDHSGRSNRRFVDDWDEEDDRPRSRRRDRDDDDDYDDDRRGRGRGRDDDDDDDDRPRRR